MKSLLFTVLAILAIVSGLVNAQAADNYTVSRTEYDQPDFQGVWNFSSNTPLERPERFGDREYLTPEEAIAIRTATLAATEAGLDSDPGVGTYNTFWFEMAGRGDNIRTSMVTYPANGRLPPPVEGAVAVGSRAGIDVSGSRPVRFMVGGVGMDGPEDRGLSERCIVGFNAGPPFLPSAYNNNVQIFQSRDNFVIMTEMVHDARIVPLDHSTHIDDEIRLWSGDSRGYWDEDTLVVETRNFNDMTQSFGTFAAPQLGTAYDKFLTERFTRTDEFTINYEFTIEDPSTFTDKITVQLPMAKVDGLLYEYACHEGNYGLLNTLRGARQEEQDAVDL